MRVALLMYLSVLAGAARVPAQEAASLQQLFEAGRYEEATRTIEKQGEPGAAGPSDAYLAAQVLLKAGQNDKARREFESLNQGDDAWKQISESARAILDSDNQRALEAAEKAVSQAPDRFEAHYQLGQAKARFDDWAGAADAFHRAAELNPGFAYAHYYAGLSYSRVKRADRTSEHLQHFLSLAPKAPERAAVQSLMRTLRGR